LQSSCDSGEKKQTYRQTERQTEKGRDREERYSHSDRQMIFAIGGVFAVIWSILMQ